MTRASLAILAVLVALGACVSTPDSAGARVDRGDAHVISRAEIDRGQWRNAYDLVRDLRPSWLRRRGADSFENPGSVQVYTDGTRLGEIGLLRTLPTAGIARLEWVDPVSAAGRWGLDHGHGVISITYSAGQDPPKP